MDTAQWTQRIGDVKQPAIENLSGVEKKPRPQREQALNCQRCNSTNTKFCYYNNYSLSQPRYFCKTCRRYWTEGGSLRNVPVGGGSRKNKRSNCAINPSKKVHPDLSPPIFSSQNSKIHQGQDLNLAYSGMPSNDFSFPFCSDFTTTSSAVSLTSSPFPVMELLKTGGIGPYIPGDKSNPVFSSGFSVHGFKPSLSFSLDHQNGYGNLQGVENPSISSSTTTLFPFEQLKPSNDQFDSRTQGESNGYWINGMLAEGSW